MGTISYQESGPRIPLCAACNGESNATHVHAHNHLIVDAVQLHAILGLTQNQLTETDFESAAPADGGRSVFLLKKSSNKASLPRIALQGVSVCED